MVTRLAILGSTGSIGRSALKVVAQHRDKFVVKALTAANSVQELARQAAEFEPGLLAVADQAAARRLKGLLPAGSKARVVYGPQGYRQAAAESGAQRVLSAMVGVAGLLPTLAAVEGGLTVALANKEVLVAGGQVITAAAHKSGALILPVDSEHSAVFQCLEGQAADQVRLIWLTASGGPFRDLPAAELALVDRARALAHPNWSMGPKITVDSATMMNKGLEAIEAHWLFNQPLAKIKIVIHPQSVVHSLVEFVDGSLLAQMGVPDMAGPISYALGYPRRLELEMQPLDILSLGPLEFRPPDLARFPALALAMAAGAEGGTAPAVLNAANEVAVQRFLEGELKFPGIWSCVESVLSRHNRQPADDLAAVLEADRWARHQAARWLAQRG